MMRTRPSLLTAADRTILWDRWKYGESIADIARELGRTPTGIAYILERDGGIAPLPRKRRPSALALSERESISRGIAAGQSVRSIATSLGRSPSTISREIQRNGSREQYRATKADLNALDRARRPKSCKLSLN